MHPLTLLVSLGDRSDKCSPSTLTKEFVTVSRDTLSSEPICDGLSCVSDDSDEAVCDIIVVER